MTDEEALRGLFAAWERGAFSTELFAEDIRFSGAQPEGQAEAVGIDGVTGFMRRFLTQWDLYRVKVAALEDLGGGRFLGTGTQHGKGSGSGMDITAPVHVAVRMKGGKIEVLHLFLARDEALEALEVGGP